jgi:hypothetical protein
MLLVPHYHGCSLVEVHIFTNHDRMGWCFSTFFHVGRSIHQTAVPMHMWILQFQQVRLLKPESCA